MGGFNALPDLHQEVRSDNLQVLISAGTSSNQFSPRPQLSGLKMENKPMAATDAADLILPSTDDDLDLLSDLIQTRIKEAPAVLLSNPGRPWEGVGYSLLAGLPQADALFLSTASVIRSGFTVRVARDMDEDVMKALSEDEDDPVSAGKWFVPTPVSDRSATRFSLVISDDLGRGDIGYCTCELSLSTRSIDDATRSEREAMNIYGEVPTRIYDGADKSFAATHWLLSTELDFLFIDEEARFEGAAGVLLNAFTAMIAQEVDLMRIALVSRGIEASLQVTASAEPHGYGGQALSVYFMKCMTAKFGEDPKSDVRKDHSFDALEKMGNALAERIAPGAQREISGALENVAVLFREARLAQRDESPLRVRLLDVIDW